MMLQRIAGSADFGLRLLVERTLVAVSYSTLSGHRGRGHVSWLPPTGDEALLGRAFDAQSRFAIVGLPRQSGDLHA